MLLPLALLHPLPASLTVDFSRPGVPVSPTLYGLMTEEINYSYDGGLYGELVRNRAFLDDPRQPRYWTELVEGPRIALEKDGPDAARPYSLHIQGEVANDGYWGFPIRPNTTYRLSILAKGDAKGSPLNARLESKDGRTTYARAAITGFGAEWKEVSARLRTGKVAPTSDARLVLSLPAMVTIHVAQVSLFGPTFNRRPNGNRPDLMEKLIAMRPKFLRFPGGNYLEGNTLADRFPWKETLGPIAARPGHPSPWGYRSTDGMGLLEFLEWCEDMHARPLLAVYAGYALNGQVIKAGPELQPIVQDALDEIEYVIGGPETKWGARRIRDGHPKPFPLECVEVGNEDGFDRSGSYEGRFVQLYDAIKAKYPKLRVISTTGGKDWLGQRYPLTVRTPDLVDEHYYASVWDMMAMATKYDAYSRTGPKVFVGEWASHDGPNPWENVGQNGPTPDMACAIADAAFLTGIERNSDVVQMSCYAPLLVNVNPGGRQWAVNLIGYDALSSFGSPSYYMQTMFGQNVGDRTVPVDLSGVPTQSRGPATLPGLFASVTRSGREVYVKVVNALPTPQPLRLDFRGAHLGQDGSAIVLSGPPSAVNSVASPRNVTPVTKELHDVADSFTAPLPATSVTVYRLHLAG